MSTCYLALTILGARCMTMVLSNRRADFLPHRTSWLAGGDNYQTQQLSDLRHQKAKELLRWVLGSCGLEHRLGHAHTFSGCLLECSLPGFQTFLSKHVGRQWTMAHVLQPAVHCRKPRWNSWLWPDPVFADMPIWEWADRRQTFLTLACLLTHTCSLSLPVPLFQKDHWLDL